MKARTASVVKGLIGDNSALLDFFSDEERRAIAKAQAYPYDQELQYLSRNILDLFHYSWLAPILEKMKSTKQLLFLSALSAKSASALQGHFKLPSLKKELPLIAKRYLKEELKKMVFEKEPVLPPDLLPSSPLNRLVGLSKNELIDLIDILPLFDLSKELSLILDPKLIKEIKSSLSQIQLKFLKILSLKRLSTLPPLGLNSWNKKEELFKILHKRGILRLALGLAFHKELLFYVARILDIGRGSLLLELAAKKRDHNISERIIKDIEEVLDFLKK